MRKTWQYQVLTRFKVSLPKTQEMSVLVDSLFKMYDGFLCVFTEGNKDNVKA